MQDVIVFLLIAGEWVSKVLCNSRLNMNILADLKCFYLNNASKMPYIEYQPIERIIELL